jgi:hypothetical protein
MPAVEQRRLEGEAAAEEEGHEIPLPVLDDLLRLVHQRSVPVDPVLADIGPEVGPGCHPDWFAAAGIEHLEQRTRLRIPLAEDQEIERHVSRQDDEVRLNEPGCHAAGRPHQLARSHQRPDVTRRAGHLAAIGHHGGWRGAGLTRTRAATRLAKLRLEARLARHRAPSTRNRVDRRR